jgi:hypothetical protein
MCFWKVLWRSNLHPDSDPKLELEMYINNTFKKGGLSLYQALQWNVHK